MPDPSQLADSYPPPCKIYEYWFTGKNKEILSYEQVFDNAYYMVSLAPDLARGVLGESMTSIVSSRANAPRTGELNKAAETVNQYITGLTDPASLSTAKINILGDPDFLMPEGMLSTGTGSDDLYTVNPNLGQIFIEIGFSEGTDYDTSLGLMSINTSIRLWPYPKEVEAKVHGRVSYLVHTVNSEFSKGKFIQTLLLAINTFGNSLPEAPDLAAGAPATAAQQSTSPPPDAPPPSGAVATPPPAATTTEPPPMDIAWFQW